MEPEESTIHTESNTNEPNILDLPDELLRSIVSYVPDKRNLTLTCNRFYDIICDLEFRTLSFFNTKILDDEEIYKSILSTRRRFRYFSVSKVAFNAHQLSQLEELLTRFGGDVKYGQLFHVNMNWELFELFNLMPNMEKLMIGNPLEEDMEIRESFKLNLHNLREFQAPDCPKMIYQVFNALPAGVLQKVLIFPDITMQYKNRERTPIVPENVFANQRNIKGLLFGFSSSSIIDFKPLKLKTLSFFGNNLKDTLEGQNELATLSTSMLAAGDLKFMCKELKSLETLSTTCDDIYYREFSHLWNLKKLKALRLDWASRYDDVNDCLKLLKTFSLRELSIECKTSLTSSTISQLGRNLPHLQSLTLKTSSSINELNTIIKHFPNLEALHWGHNQSNKEAFIFQEELEHAKLKCLTIDGRNDSELMMLVVCCSKLEELTTALYHDENSLRTILFSLPNLHRLRLECIRNPSARATNKFVEILSDHGQKLKHFYSSRLVFDPEVTQEMLELKFKQRFSKIRLFDDASQFCKDSLLLSRE